MKFIRKNGRIIPIKEKADKKEIAKGIALGTAGVATSVIGSKLAFQKLSKFKIAGMLATVFAGEAMAAEGIDKTIENFHMNKRTEQNYKNVAGGTIGVIGAASALGSGIFIKKNNLIKLLK